jgi:O-antigen/teichoic acid export membrane protein
MRIISKLKKTLSNLLNKGDSRLVLLKKNVAVSFVLKGIGLGIGYVRFPLTLSYLGNAWYGVWLTIGSFTGWLSFFNIGLGNGLKNKLAESLAKQNIVDSKKYVSSTYYVISLISIGIYIALIPVIFWVDWNHIFNVEDVSPAILRMSLLAFVTFFCMKFVLRILRTVFEADQKPAFSDMMDFFSSTLFFVAVILLINYAESSLVYVVAIHGALPVVLLIGFSIYYYNNSYKAIRPSFKYVDRKLLKGLANLGVKFFIIQTSVLVLYSTDNIIITRILGPEEVVGYAAARKFFGIVDMGFSIVLVPFWSAFTDAYTKGEIDWVKRSIYRLLKLVTLVALGLTILFFISPWVYEIWLGDKVEISWQLSLLMAVFVLVRAWSNVFIYFINGVGKVKLQLLISIFICVVNIPLSIFLVKEFGLIGVIMATIACLIIGAFVYPIQYLKIIRKDDKGIWGK